MVMYKIDRRGGGGAWGGSKNRILGQTPYNSASLLKKIKRGGKAVFFIGLLYILLFLLSSPFRHKTGKRRSLEEI